MNRALFSTLIGLVLLLPATDLPIRAVGPTVNPAGGFSLAFTPKPLFIPITFCGDDECYAHTTCQPKVYGACTFVKQKANGKCIYDCEFEQTCRDTECTCEVSEPYIIPGTDRFRSGSYPPGQCPGVVDTSWEIIAPGSE